jgi:micrococcal nuclease
LQREGQEFESPYLHNKNTTQRFCFIFRLWKILGDFKKKSLQIFKSLKIKQKRLSLKKPFNCRLIFNMRRIKNKTFYFLILGFVFLFLISRLHFNQNQKITAEDIVKTNSASAKLINQSSATLKEKIETEENNASSSPIKFSAQNISQKYYKVVKVVDGDTIDIIMNGKTERLRLIGINTPEVVDPRKTVECFGREASDNAKKLLSGQEVRVEADLTQDDRDKYGRLLRYVWRRDGLFYNLEAIKDGFAYEYTYQLPYIYQKDFKAAQKYAEDNKLGLWADGACGVKNIKPAAISGSAKSGCVIKGNIGAKGDKIYHLPNCPYYKNTVINESQGEKWFCSETEAIAAGWRKAKNCP